MHVFMKMKTSLSLLDVDLARIPNGFVLGPDEVNSLLAHADKGDKRGFGLQALVNLSYRAPGRYPQQPALFCDERLQTLAIGHDAIAAMPPDRHRMIAKAGFSRCGNTTTLTCYHCGCQAANWEPDDDPWNRHAELQPNCPVVKRGVTTTTEGGRPVDRLLKRSVSCE
ncbi:E3 ubiquitin-protein ligase XIAP-like isoform X2 [Haliotis rufescens]|uniref:E3 ubiquitin-protein ligase XIAP-like isoform X2 n=1 Tax=Haliotis rufescens TaxID=6454 RepID=UPI00201F560F|nr:E3 ubiquitin-protein ligase XIAP-like isoform X2 [Haliotis rufescens]